MKTFVIAEAGSNHNRVYTQALALIDIAKASGASAVKFQTYSSETLYAKNTPNFGGYKNLNKLIKDIELPREWQKDLKDYCDDKNIEFMSTPFDEGAVEELVDLGVKRLKIAGFESTDFRFVEMVASTKLPLIISLGIGFDSTVRRRPSTHMTKLFDIINKYENDLTLLHCNNAYPTPISDCGLHILQRLVCYTKTPPIGAPWRYPYSPGFSDHTISTSIPSTAVALGAKVIEKHFTSDRQLPGPDHPFALEPEELKEMILLINETEKAMMPVDGKLSESEKPNVLALRSVVTSKEVRAGEVVSIDNITTMRPCVSESIPAGEYHNIIGKKFIRNIGINEIVFKEYIK